MMTRAGIFSLFGSPSVLSSCCYACRMNGSTQPTTASTSHKFITVIRILFRFRPCLTTKGSLLLLILRFGATRGVLLNMFQAEFGPPECVKKHHLFTCGKVSNWDLEHPLMMRFGWLGVCRVLAYLVSKQTRTTRHLILLIITIHPELNGSI